jgi:hypothetical protein
MPRQNHCSLSDELVGVIPEQGLVGLPELVRIVTNAAMPAERQSVLRAALYERTPERRGLANGCRP